MHEIHEDYEAVCLLNGTCSSVKCQRLELDTAEVEIKRSMVWVSNLICFGSLTYNLGQDKHQATWTEVTIVVQAYCLNVFVFYRNNILYR